MPTTPAGTFPGIDTPLLAKRQDGSTIPIAIIATEGLTQLQGRISRQEVGGNCWQLSKFTRKLVKVGRGTRQPPFLLRSAPNAPAHANTNKSSRRALHHIACSFLQGMHAPPTHHPSFRTHCTIVHVSPQ